MKPRTGGEAAATHMPTQMDTTNRPANVGHSLNDQTSRLDAVAKVTGKARYSRDMYVDNQLFVGYIRCPFGQAKLTSSDQDAARQIPGILEVTIQGDSGKFDGHSIGYIVAESRHALRRSLTALNPQWQREQVKTQISDTELEIPKIKDETVAALKAADHVLDAVYSTPVQTHSALETHGVMIDHRGDSATIYASTQGTFSVRDEIGKPLDLAASKFQVICEYVGGGFGAKFGPDKQGMTAAEVSAKYKRPVYVFCDRQEEHLDTGNRPSMHAVARIGIAKDGTVLGGQIAKFGGVGVARGGGDANLPSDRYRFANIEKSHRNVQFNAGGPRAMRAPGHPQGAFAEELIIDELAAMCSIDPLAMRLKLDQEESRREMYQLGAKTIGWEQRSATGAQTGTMRRGFGIGSCSWGAFPAPAAAEVIIHRDGSVEVRTGTQDIGTGQRTIMGILAAEHLGVPLRMVDVRIGSSNLPEGPGSGGSMTAHNTAVAMIAAAIDARSKLLKSIADRLGGDASDYEIHDGEIRKAGQTILSWAEACQKMGPDTLSGKGNNDEASRKAHFGKGHSNGAQFVDLEVDTETGLIHVKRIVAIQSCGKVVCRKTAESQIIGGVIQGLSFALFENKILDRQTGAMVNPNLEMYKIAGPMDMPLIEPLLWDKDATGVRSLGEPPVVPTAGAIACAVFNAIGAPVRHLPLTPDKVLAALELAAKGGAA
jgi:xanthine dehydrogenase YagR molybdenum-binding subunit